MTNQATTQSDPYALAQVVTRLGDICIEAAVVSGRQYRSTLAYTFTWARSVLYPPVHHLFVMKGRGRIKRWKLIERRWDDRAPVDNDDLNQFIWDIGNFEGQLDICGTEVCFAPSVSSMSEMGVFQMYPRPKTRIENLDRQLLYAVGRLAVRL